MGRSMSARPRYHRPNRWVWDSGDDVRWAVRTIAQALGAGVSHHDWHDASRKRRHRGRWIWRSDPRWFANARPRGPFLRVPEPPRGDHSFTATGLWVGTGSAIREDMDTLTGETGYSRGEDCPSLSSKLLTGPDKMRCARGSLVGSFPEALHGEAPEGQPKNRGETLEAVCVEAPKGQPRNHRPQRKQHSRMPMGRKEREKRSTRSRKAPPSSQWR